MSRFDRRPDLHSSTHVRSFEACVELSIVLVDSAPHPCSASTWGVLCMLRA